MPKSETKTAVGLGLRRALIPETLELPEGTLDFLELAPENWIRVGGRFGKQLDALAERYPFYLHGLSLDIGGTAPLQMELLEQIKGFIKRFHCPVYSEHLTFCADEGQLYDLLPIPFTEEAVHYVAERIKRVQDFLGRRISLENASYYAAPAAQLSELEFINAVIAEADCELLLDVNNIYVNSVNHGYDPEQFLKGLPHNKVSYIHIAGHYVESDTVLIDTHGTAVKPPVWQLLDRAFSYCGVLPTLLERDVHFPAMQELVSEIDQIKASQATFISSNLSKPGKSKR